MRPGRECGIVLGSLLASALLVGLVWGSPESDWRRWDTVPLGLDLYRPIPVGNPLTLEKVALGKRLFFDPLLSKDRTLSCASCHRPGRGFTDGKALSVGVFGRQGTRSVPTLVNRVYGKSFFWDGRVSTLEEQVLQPILNPLEMGLELREAESRLTDHAEYSAAFDRIFGRKVAIRDVSHALSSYVRTILSGNSPYDRYLDGEREALSEGARKGLKLFQGKARCTQCHLGPNLTDEDFHNTGVAWQGGQLQDEGRFQISGRIEDEGAFKTPTLREISKTAPYMHDGTLSSLEDVIEFYKRGGNANPQLDRRMRSLNLTEPEETHLVAFLQSLAGSAQ